MKKIVLSNQKNIRDLGGLIGYDGKKVKFGRLFRGGYLGKVNNDDVLIIDSLKLTDIIDFRGQEEFVNRPDYQFAGVNYHNYPVMKEDVKKEKSKSEDSNLLWFLKDSTNGFDHMYNLYPDLLIKPIGINAYRNFFNLLTSKNDGVFLFHCSQGKDRAGLAAYLLETALGIDESICRKDYLLTNKAMKIRVQNYIMDLKNKSFYSKEYENALKDVFYAREEYLNHALEVIIDKYGSVSNYINNELRVDIDRLCKLYLE